MKVVSCLLVLFFIFQFSSIYCQSQRGINPEAVALEILFKGKCSQVKKVISSIRISSHDNNSTCLPISPVTPNDDFNDLSFHHLCRNIDYHGRKSLLRLVEIFNGTYDNPLPAGYSYIISLVSPIPFKVKASVEYVFAPRCTYHPDFCTNVTVVTACKERPINIDDDVDEKGFVLNEKERIYVLFPGQTIQSCKNDNSVCCSYITPDDQGLCKPEGFYQEEKFSYQPAHHAPTYQTNNYNNYNSYQTKKQEKVKKTI